MLVKCLYPLSYWSSGIGAENKWYVSIDTFCFSGLISLPFNLHGEYKYSWYVQKCLLSTSTTGYSSSHSAYNFFFYRLIQLKMLSLIILCRKKQKTKVGPKQKLRDKNRPRPRPTERHRQLEKVSCYGSMIGDKPGL